MTGFNSGNEPCCFIGCNEKPTVLAAIVAMRRYVEHILRPECRRFSEYMCGTHFDRLSTDRASFCGGGSA